MAIPPSTLEMQPLQHIAPLDEGRGALAFLAGSLHPVNPHWHLARAAASATDGIEDMSNAVSRVPFQ